MKGYLSAIDYFSKENYVKNNKLGDVDVIFCGYSIYWLARNHKKRFKAFYRNLNIKRLQF